MKQLRGGGVVGDGFLMFRASLLRLWCCVLVGAVLLGRLSWSLVWPPGLVLVSAAAAAPRFFCFSELSLSRSHCRYCSLCLCCYCLCRVHRRPVCVGKASAWPCPDSPASTTRSDTETSETAAEALHALDVLLQVHHGRAVGWPCACPWPHADCKFAPMMPSRRDRSPRPAAQLGQSRQASGAEHTGPGRANVQEPN